MAVWYNEVDKGKAAWLRNLIAAGLIAPGDVDERDIRDIVPADLAGYAQCHFFAGIGVWSYALRAAGWPDDRPVWTGSCPCQSFSSAGKRAGFADERHLWPSWFHLVRIRRPVCIFGEQVSSPDALAWLDLVSADLEGENYACGSLDLCAAGVGAPHARQRLFWMADAQGERLEGWRDGLERVKTRPGGLLPGRPGDDAGDVAHSDNRGSQERWTECDGATGDAEHEDLRSASPELCKTGKLADPMRTGRAERRASAGDRQATGCGESGVVGNPESLGRRGRENDRNEGRRECPPRQTGTSGELGDSNGERCGSGPAPSRSDQRPVAGTPDPERPGSGRAGASESPGAAPTNGFWADAEWIPCRDGKVRPVEPGTFPLSYGAPARVLRLRAYGDCIVGPLAEEFIRAYLGGEG